MNRQMAMSIAEALGGEAVPDDRAGGEGRWAVSIERRDGRMVLITEESVDEFYDRDALAERHCFSSISLA